MGQTEYVIECDECGKTVEYDNTKRCSCNRVICDDCYCSKCEKAPKKYSDDY